MRSLSDDQDAGPLDLEGDKRHIGGGTDSDWLAAVADASTRWQLPLDPLEEGRVTRPCNEDLTRASNETTFSNEGFQKRSSNEASKNVRPDI